MLLIRDHDIATRVQSAVTNHLTDLHGINSAAVDVRAVQRGKLERTLRAASEAPLYAEKLRPLLADRNGEAADSTLTRLPFLMKSEISDGGFAAFHLKPPEFLHYYESSGTTSVPVAAPKAIDDLIINTLNIGEMWGRLLKPGDVALILIIAPLAPAPYQFEKALEYLGVMSLRPSVDYAAGDYTKVIELCRSLSVNTFVGAPSRLLAIIQFASRHRIPLPQFDYLLLVAEQMGPSLLHHLERLTGAKAYVASYGSSETGTVAVTCEEGQLHLQLHSFLLELYREGRAGVIDGTPSSGELVVTTLDLAARPLLRYRTGDLVEVIGEGCDCGLPTPVMRTLGRVQDVLALPGRSLRQEDVEAVLWPRSSAELVGSRVMNYMLIIHGHQLVVLVTTDGPANPSWVSGLAKRLRPLFPAHQVTVRPVDALSPLATLSGDLGWKLSRVVDLDQPRIWERLPAHLAPLVRETLAGVSNAIPA